MIRSVTGPTTLWGAALHAGRPDIAASPRRIAVVGNAQGLGPHARAIDAADWVIRFNNAAGFGGEAGRRVTHLCLLNFGGQAAEWLADPGFVRRPVLQAAGGFVLPIHPGAEALADPLPVETRRRAPGDHDWTPEIAVALASLARPVWLMPGEWEEDCRRLLAAGGAPARDGAASVDRHEGDASPAPSSGFLVVRRLVEAPELQDVAIDCYGFGFAGWEGHAWDAERRWFEDRVAEERLRLHVPDGANAEARCLESA